MGRRRWVSAGSREERIRALLEGGRFGPFQEKRIRQSGCRRGQLAASGCKGYVLLGQVESPRRDNQRSKLGMSGRLRACGVLSSLSARARARFGSADEISCFGDGRVAR